MNLLTPDPGLLFWMLLCFGVVFFVLAKYGWPLILKMVEDRKAFIDNALESAKQANEQLAGIKQEGERILNTAREEQTRILREANDMKSKIVNDAKEAAGLEAAKIVSDAKEVIQKEKELAMKDIHNQIALLSIDIAEKVLRKNLDNKAAQNELVNKLIEEAQKN